MFIKALKKLGDCAIAVVRNGVTQTAKQFTKKTAGVLEINISVYVKPVYDAIAKVLQPRAGELH